MATINGTNGNDTLTGGMNGDTINGGNGDDKLLGAAGADTLNGGNGQDALDGGTGNDVLSGGNGEDILDGGAGDDIVRGDNGDDIAAYAMSENLGDSDFYDGGNGSDRLRLLLTQSQLNSTAVQTDLQAYQAFLESGKKKDFAFNFSAFDLTARNFEQFEIVIVPGGNQTPTDISLSGNAVTENSAVGTVVGSLSATDPDAAESFTFTLIDDAGGRFAISGSNIVVAGALDFETAMSHQVTIRVTDAGGLFRTETFAITVTNVNEIPADIALAGNTVAENAAGATIGTLSTVRSGQRRHPHLHGERRALRSRRQYAQAQDGQSLDHESGSSINIDVTSTDAGGLFRTETFTINVTDVNEAPIAINLGNSAVNENDGRSRRSAPLTGSDPDAADTLTFSVDDARFEVVDGILKLKDGVALDFEQEPEVLVTVTATDTAGNTLDRAFTINVKDGFEATALDGYIAGATVFADANDNGVLDDGEVSATTDAFGNFTLFGGSGPLVMSGGTDISTNQAFEGVMRAPEGSTVVTPLTTLVVAIAEATAEASGQPIDFAAANSQLLEGLGLPADIDLSTFDPIAATLSSDPSAQAQGEAAMAASVQIQNTIVQAASLLEGAGGSFANAAAAVVAELAVQISAQADNDLAIDLNSSSVIQSVITEAAANTAGADPRSRG